MRELDLARRAAMARIQTRTASSKAAAPQPVQGDSAALPDTPSAPTTGFIEAERRHAIICEAAYFIAAKRDFCPGRELDDWLQAESELYSSLTAAMPGARGRPVKDGTGEG
jgi:hypothetical protein